MKGLMLIQNCFEDTEALTTIDILRRGNLDIDLVNMSDNEIIITQYKNQIIVNTFYGDIDIENYDFLVIPGGQAVERYLINDKRVYEIIDYFVTNKKLVACICAAPVLLRNYLNNKIFTCFPSYASRINGKYSGHGVEVTDNFVLGKSMYYTIDFALEIVNYLKKDINVLIKQIKAE